MTNSDWEILEAAFAEATGLEGDDRVTMLAKFADEHPDLEQQLLDLLTADRSDDELLAEPIASSARALAETTVDPWENRRIGAWTIKRRIADGGMGAVFLAERADDEYQQTVALKIMTAQLLARDAVARFRAERQILASLSHPNIATLIDGGSTDENLPFLVLEYIDGLPIDEYCDEHKLSIAARLQLFIKVCEAVDFAHRSLVVHRDLKPNNILVDNSGEPKLLDFGIAKLLENSSVHQTVAVTREGMRAMTPEYASPEQVRGEAISVATDVYALGVLLYRLMTGQSPYGVSTAVPREYEVAILDNEPRRPSTVVTLPDTEADVGTRRATSAHRLQRSLAGDLDNIVLHALHKEPARRYPTANALSTDIGRYLANLPVMARGDDWPYKLRKFAVRNARNLAVALLIITSITTLAIYYTLKLADERDRANLAAAKSNEVAGFLTGLFESASPHEAKGDPITAVELLEQGSERIEELDGQPQLKAELMRIMASSMTALGNLERSIPMLERVLELKEAAVPRDQISISQTTHNLAEAYRQLGNLDQAEHYQRRTLEIATAAFGPDNSDVAYLMARLGVILFDASKTEEALDMEQRALAILVANGDGESPDALDTRGNISNALSRLGRHRDAEQMLRDTIALSEQVIGELHPNTIIRRTNLCLVLIRMGKLDESLAILDQNIPRGVQVWGPDYYHVAFMHGTRAAALKRLGRMQESLDAYLTAQEITRLRSGEDNMTYVRNLRGTASLLIDLARYEEAGLMLDEALAKAISIGGEQSADADNLRLRRGLMDNRRKRYAQAAGVLRPLMAARGSFSAANFLMLKRELAQALSAQGQFDEAETLILATIAEQEETLGQANAVNLSSYAVAAELYRHKGELDESLVYGEKIAAIVQDDLSPLAWEGALALLQYGHTLKALGRDGDARAVFRQSYNVLQSTFGDTDPRVVEIRELTTTH
ncbi:MAG TPA: serine/threonine-protein kinase [Woeseiaceae bacterium]|nr:serine/threonine-protein kinase [Woeseiaceae bacterium]